jgi:hypothetical protein
MAFEKFFWGSRIFYEGWPNFSIRRTVRLIVVFFSTVGLFWSLIGDRKPKLVLFENIGPERISIGLVLLFSVITLYLFTFHPSIFNSLSKEDGLIEQASAIFLFGSCIITLFALIKYKHEIKDSMLTKLSLGFLSFIFFVMAMEEVSWFQRVLEIETPEAFEGNVQHEMNLHNFATGTVENLFYIGSFVFLVLFPFFRFLLAFIGNNKYLKIFIARPFIAVIGSIACAYNFDMWNIVFIQMTFIGSLVILSVFAIFSCVKNETYLLFFTILLITTSQFLFLFKGENFDRLWEITEYKEFYISLAFLIYTIDVLSQMKREFSLKKVGTKA